MRVQHRERFRHAQKQKHGEKERERKKRGRSFREDAHLLPQAHLRCLLPCAACSCAAVRAALSRASPWQSHASPPPPLAGLPCSSAFPRRSTDGRPASCSSAAGRQTSEVVPDEGEVTRHPALHNVTERHAEGVGLVTPLLRLRIVAQRRWCASRHFVVRGAMVHHTSPPVPRHLALSPPPSSLSSWSVFSARRSVFSYL